MRYLIGTARVDQSATATDLYQAVVNAVDGEGNQEIHLRLPSDLGGIECPAELVVTVHRVILESLTNARKYAPVGSTVYVEVRVEKELDSPGELVIEVESVRATVDLSSPARGGYGLVGMTERVAMVGGELTAGPSGSNGWLVAASLPLLSPTSSAESHVGVI